MPLRRSAVVLDRSNSRMPGIVEKSPTQVRTKHAAVEDDRTPAAAMHVSNGARTALSASIRPVAQEKRGQGCPRSVYAFALFALFFCIAPPATFAASKPILVHYMPWFVAKPYNSSWGWHWTMNHYNPDTIDGSGHRQIASHYYPLIGPYDSADPAVLEYHVLLMKLAGLDGVIVDWYGQTSCLDYGTLNQNTGKLFTYTKKAGLKFSICYEDQSIQHMIDNGCIASSAATSQAQLTMLYLQSNYWADPSYFQWSNKPVLLNFGPQYFKMNSQWQTIFSVLYATNQPAFFTEDNKYAVGSGAFPWPPMWMTGGGTNVLTTNQLESYLSTFYSNGNGWPASVGGGWPRFNDIYAQAGVGTSNGYLDDRNGDTLRETTTRAMTNNCAFIQMVTWNDFGEGTIIEPTVDYGYRDLGLLQDFRRQYMQTNFTYTTNDLALAFRFYNLRRQWGNYPTQSAELDRTFTNIVAGKLDSATRQIWGMENSHAVMYGFSSSSNQMQFFIGGFLLSGAQVQMATNLAAPVWQTVRTYPASANPIVFSTNFVSTPASFFRVQ